MSFDDDDDDDDDDYYDDDMEEDFDDDDNDFDGDDDDNDNEYRKCLTCEHWGGNIGFTGGDIERFGQASGKCYCKGGNNPHYLYGDRMAANDGCDFWERHPRLG